MSEMIDELLADARERMAKSVESTSGEFGSVRTGRASPALLDRVNVDYYGAMTPLKQLATVNAPEARLLTVQPFDQSSIPAVERATLALSFVCRLAATSAPAVVEVVIVQRSAALSVMVRSLGIIQDPWLPPA